MNIYEYKLKNYMTKVLFIQNLNYFNNLSNYFIIILFNKFF